MLLNAYMRDMPNKSKKDWKTRQITAVVINKINLFLMKYSS